MELHPEIDHRAASASARVTKSFSSVFAGTDLESWAPRTWAEAAKNGHELQGSDLGTSAAQGRSAR